MNSDLLPSEPHYKGHRQRLRARFLKGGKDSLAEYELLELILFMAIPQRDVKPLAKSLLTKFGSLGAVLHAPFSELESYGLSENSIATLKVIEAASFELLKSDIMKQPILNSWTKLLDYLKATMEHDRNEHFRVIFLNKKNEIIADEIQQSGTVDHTQAYPREIMKRALELSSTAIILVHNHPSGDPTPSKPDIDMTKQIIDSGKPFSIVIHDHIIVSKSGTTSFKQLGLI
jgi:DNA repair protein RadC